MPEIIHFSMGEASAGLEHPARTWNPCTLSPLRGWFVAATDPTGEETEVGASKPTQAASGMTPGRSREATRQRLSRRRQVGISVAAIGVVILAVSTGVVGAALWELVTEPDDPHRSRTWWLLVLSATVSVVIAVLGTREGALELERFRPFRRVNRIVPGRPFTTIITAVSGGHREQRSVAEALVDGFHAGGWDQLANRFSPIRPWGVILSAVARTQGALDRLVLVPSVQSLCDAFWLKALLERLFDAAGQDITVVIAGRNGSTIDPRDMSTDDCANYQDVVGMYELFETILNDHDPDIPDAYICLLASPGTTAVGIAAAMTTMNRDCCFEYVTQGDSSEPRYFDVGMAQPESNGTSR